MQPLPPCRPARITDCPGESHPVRGPGHTRPLRESAEIPAPGGPAAGGAPPAPSFLRCWLLSSAHLPAHALTIVPLGLPWWPAQSPLFSACRARLSGVLGLTGGPRSRQCFQTLSVYYTPRKLALGPGIGVVTVLL